MFHSPSAADQKSWLSELQRCVQLLQEEELMEKQSI